MDGDECPAEQFLITGESATKASRIGLFSMLQFVAERGLHAAPAAWHHEVNKEQGIYEFKKGDLRLFFFKGSEGTIAVCTTGILKKGQKVDAASVSKAARLKSEYEVAIRKNTYEVVDDED